MPTGVPVAEPAGPVLLCLTAPRMRPRRGFHPRARIAEGKARRTICDVAKEVDPEAIVLGAHGLGRVGGMLLGSVSSAVAVHAKQPVLIVPHRPAD